MPTCCMFSFSFMSEAEAKTPVGIPVCSVAIRPNLAELANPPPPKLGGNYHKLVGKVGDLPWVKREKV